MVNLNTINIQDENVTRSSADSEDTVQLPLSRVVIIPDESQAVKTSKVQKKENIAVQAPVKSSHTLKQQKRKLSSRCVLQPRSKRLKRQREMTEAVWTEPLFISEQLEVGRDAAEDASAVESGELDSAPSSIACSSVVTCTSSVSEGGQSEIALLHEYQKEVPQQKSVVSTALPSQLITVVRSHSDSTDVLTVPATSGQTLLQRDVICHDVTTGSATHDCLSDSTTSIVKSPPAVRHTPLTHLCGSTSTSSTSTAVQPVRVTSSASSPSGGTRSTSTSSTSTAVQSVRVTSSASSPSSGTRSRSTSSTSTAVQPVRVTSSASSPSGGTRSTSTSSTSTAVQPVRVTSSASSPSGGTRSTSTSSTSTSSSGTRSYSSSTSETTFSFPVRTNTVPSHEMISTTSAQVRPASNVNKMQTATDGQILSSRPVNSIQQQQQQSCVDVPSAVFCVPSQSQSLSLQSPPQSQSMVYSGLPPTRKSASCADVQSQTTRPRVHYRLVRGKQLMPRSSVSQLSSKHVTAHSIRQPRSSASVSTVERCSASAGAVQQQALLPVTGATLSRCAARAIPSRPGVRLHQPVRIRVSATELGNTADPAAMMNHVRGILSRTNTLPSDAQIHIRYMSPPTTTSHTQTAQSSSTQQTTTSEQVNTKVSQLDGTADSDDETTDVAQTENTRPTSTGEVGIDSIHTGRSRRRSKAAAADEAQPTSDSHVR